MIISCSQPVKKNMAFSSITIWNMPASGKMVPAPRTLTIDNSGNLLVLDSAGQLITYNPQGKIIKKWSMPETKLGHPEGVCVLKDGKIAVADTHYNRIVIFNPTGSVYKIWGKKGIKAGEFSNPVGICKDANGDLFVCEYGNTDRIQKFTVDGKSLLTFGKNGTKPGDFQRASGLIWHKNKIYVADAVNNRIQIFSDKGKLLQVIDKDTTGKPLFYLPYDIFLGIKGKLYIVEYGNSCIAKLELDGKLIGKFGSAGSNRDQFKTPWGIAIDANGRIFVADTGNRRIIVLEKYLQNNLN